MLKQSPSRNPRVKEFKVKHAIQICVLLVICIWLLYQVKQTYNGQANNADQTSIDKEEVLRLGRKGLNPQLKDIDLESGKKEDDNDQDDDKGIDRIAQEKTEEEETEQLEDLIDEDDKQEERTIKGSELLEREKYIDEVIRNGELGD